MSRSDTPPELPYEAFDVAPPAGANYDEHLAEMSRRLLRLADQCRGFRVLVAGQTFLTYLAQATPDYVVDRVESPHSERDLAFRVGYWRNYETYVDTRVEGTEAYLGERVGRPLGWFKVTESFTFPY